jgi:hypothetical protein
LERAQSTWFCSDSYFLLILFAVSWCFLTLLDLSLLSFIQHRVWKFAQWDKFAILWQLFNGAAAYLTIVSSVYVKQTGENLRIEERRNAELKYAPPVPKPLAPGGTGGFTRPA